MELDEIFEKANELIEVLNQIYDEDLLEYIINEIQSNGYCDNDRYSDFINEKYYN